MKILSLDSSGMVASAALLTDEILTAEYTLNHKKTHSQTLMSMLDEIVRMTDWDLESVDAIAIAKGPGSFTGLRIGSAAVKGLAHALDKPVVEVPTLEAMAYQAYGYMGLIAPIMDARRSQVYTAAYTFDEKGKFTCLMESSALSVEEFVSKLKEFGRPVMLMGDGVPVYEEKIRSLMHDGFDVNDRTAGSDITDGEVDKSEGSDVCDILIAPPHMNRQRAASVAALGALYVKEGKTVSAAQHTPLYLRKPQAERELEAGLLKT